MDMEDKRQCYFFVTKRKRLCRLIPAKGKRFCGEHLNQERESTEKTSTEKYQNGLCRIPCPYDSHHTVAVKQLSKHLKVCNSRPKEQPVYYQRGINAVTADVDECLESLRLASFSLKELRDVIAKIESAFTDHVPDIQTRVLHHAVLKPELDNQENGPSARKHLVQLDSLLGHMTRLKLLNPGTRFIELGAGRGRLTQWIQQVLQGVSDTSFLLVDRAAVRHKRDAFYQRDDGGPSYERINMDIENLCLGRVPSISSHPTRPVVAYTKHLCGGATDLALRCLMETWDKNTIVKTKPSSAPHPEESGALMDEPGTQRKSEKTVNSDNDNEGSVDGHRCHLDHENTNVRHADSDSVVCDGTKGHGRSEEGNPVRGIAMATCCHHRCSWKSYVGRQFILDVGLTEREFAAVVRMSSWATCGMRVAKDDGGRDGTVDGGKTDGGRDENDGENVTRRERTECGDGNGEITREQTAEMTEQGEEVNELESSDCQGESGDCQVEQETIVSALGLSVPEREEIGFRCKRVLDTGRLVYLKNCGLDTQLVYYVERRISPENCLLIATSGIEHL